MIEKIMRGIGYVLGTLLIGLITFAILLGLFAFIIWALRYIGLL